MDQTTLVAADIEEGKRLLEALDQADFPVVAALWLYLPEPGVWRYVIASPLVDEKGPRECYARIESVRTSTSPAITIPLENISVVSPKDHLIGELRLHAGTPGRPFIGGLALCKSMVGELYVENSYIYRTERIIGVSGTTDMLFAIPLREKHQWQKRPGKMTTRGGYIVSVVIENYDLPFSTGQNGINAALFILTKLEHKDGKLVGDIQRMKVLDGRVRAFEEVATGVEVVD